MRLRGVMLVLLLGLLAGCSPKYNWRDVAVADGAVKAVFPDKPIIRTRKLDFQGHAIQLTFTMAQIDGTLFAVGYAPLPPVLREDETLRKAMGQQVMGLLYQNMQMPVPKNLPQFGEDFAIRNAALKGAGKLQAKVWMTPQALVEGIVTGDATSFPQAEANQFLRSLQVQSAPIR